HHAHRVDALSARRALPVALPRRDHRAHRGRLQPAGRWAARVARSSAEALTMATLLSVRDLVVRFRTREGTVHAVNDVSFDLEEGETLGLVGESGCGKSVTNLAIMRLLPKPAGHIEGGSVLFDGEDLVTMEESEV